MQKTKKHNLASVRSVVHIYWRQTMQFAWLFAFVLIGDIGMQIADLVSPLYLRSFFNTLSGGHPTPSLVNALFGTVMLYGVVLFISWAFRRLQSRSIMKLELGVMHNLTATGFGYLLDHSYNFFTSNFAGTLTHKINRFARVYEVLIDAVLLTFFPTLLFVIGAIVVLYHQHPSLGVALAVWAVIFTGFQIWVAGRRQPLRALRAEEESKATGIIADAISNHPTVMLFSGIAHETSLLKAASTKLREATRRVWYADDWIWGAMGFFMVLINVGMLAGATVLWSRGQLTLGDFVLMQSYLLSTFNLLLGINRELRRFYDALADAQEMVYILELPHEVEDISRAKKLQVSTGAISFLNVDFYFDSTKPILKHFDLHINEKEKVALVGPSGAGKSTITKLLLRLYDVKDGEIQIDTQTIANVTQDSLREAIGFVPQEPILFHRTLMENIRYGRRNATDEEVFAATKAAHCHEFIDALPEKYNTYVGERGVKLSGGERQRVAIARAILKNAPILVLDEATSSLDSESEHLIQQALDTLMQGKTVIVIAHRLSTIMKMDRIVVIDGGKVVADGTHTELLAQDGLYTKLWNIQAGGFIASDVDTPAEDKEDIVETIGGLVQTTFEEPEQPAA